MSRQALFALLLVAAVCAGATSRPRVDILSYFSEEEKACFSDKKILFRNQCYQLLTRGPCQDTEWLVLDMAAALNGTDLPVPTCSQCRCCNETNSIYWPAKRQCRKLSATQKKELCGLAGTEPKTDLFGEGECTCITDPPHTRLFSNRQGACYELYHRGPCGEREVVLPKPDEPEVGICARSNCSSKSIYYKKGYAQHTDGNCYPIGGTQPCQESQKFKISPQTLKPECITTGSTSPLDPGNRCDLDPDSQQCIEEVAAEKTTAKIQTASSVMKTICKAKRGRKPAFCTKDETPNGETATDETPNGETAKDETPSGETTEDETSTTSQLNEGGRENVGSYNGGSILLASIVSVFISNIN